MGNLLSNLFCAILCLIGGTSCPGLGVATGPGGTGVLNVQSNPVNVAAFTTLDAALADLLVSYKIDHPSYLESPRERSTVERLTYAQELVSEGRQALASGQAWQPSISAALDTVRALARDAGRPWYFTFLGLETVILALLQPVPGAEAPPGLTPSNPTE